MFDVTPYVECLFQVHPATATQIIQHESGGKPWVLNVNALKGQKPPKFKQPNNQQDAIALARQFIQQGHTVDLGLMQINSNNLPHYRVTLEQIFDPCTNLRVGSTILYEGYQRALGTTKNPQIALQKALSIYSITAFKTATCLDTLKAQSQPDPPQHKSILETCMTKPRDLIKINDASFEERQALTMQGAMVEFTPSELEQMGALPDDTPLTEDDYLEDEDNE
ncbi:TPA: lytic transglycosylase domain-containing protein [Vibrio parahaemolyticus]